MPKIKYYFAALTILFKSISCSPRLEWNEDMDKKFPKVKSVACQRKVLGALQEFMDSVYEEKPLPFAEFEFKNECTQKMDPDLVLQPTSEMMYNLTYYGNETSEYKSAEDIKLLYLILAHDDPDDVIRLISALTPHNSSIILPEFVVHVDAKEEYMSTHQVLSKMYYYQRNVHILDSRYRVRVNWGGFSMVNATLQSLRYIFAIDRPTRYTPIKFDKLVHLSASSYPIASNQKIVNTMAKFPLDANFFNIIMDPNNPAAEAWHYFVECDDAVHRIYRLSSPKGEDVHLYTHSQWFIASYEFAKYLATKPDEDTFYAQYLDYAEHVVVADEHFFGMVLRHTEFCHMHHNRNYLHLHFDRWENEQSEGEERDSRKCLFPDPDHCGRSPTIITLDYLPMLEISDDLFARKFDESVDSTVKDAIDDMRNQEKDVKYMFDDLGVLIVAKDTVNDDTPLCLGLGESKNIVRLIPCFRENIAETLALSWETGAVVEWEANLHSRWSLGPCSFDGSISRLSNATIAPEAGKYNTEGPRCQLKQMDGLRKGRCLDAEVNDQLLIYPCRDRWNQFVSFGSHNANVTTAMAGSMFTSIPLYTLRGERSHTEIDDHHACFAVHVPEDELNFPLSEWVNEPVVSTMCSNASDSNYYIIEWIFVPFIKDEDGLNVEYIEDDLSIKAGQQNFDVYDEL